MALLKTSDDVGLLIRQRRKALGWDQAGLAERAGVSRQWIIDIEKGKPRAEIHLALRVMNVLGLRLSADAPSTDRAHSAQQAPDIDAVVAAHRSPSDPIPATEATRARTYRRAGTGVDYSRIMEEVEREFGLASTRPAAAPAPPGKRGK